MKNMLSSESNSLYIKYKAILKRSVREFQYLGTRLQHSEPDKYAIWCKVAQTI